jgi:lipopolysaccharide exporter
MSLSQKIIKSSSLLIGIKLFQRSIGLISILILARLLTPDDFAIVALTAITVHFFDMLSSAGSEQYIIQKDDVVAADLNTAWTIDIVFKSALWFVLILFSSIIAVFFEQPELEIALYASSFILIINALKNPGFFVKKQNFEYGEIFWLSVFQRLVTFVLVIVIAYIEKSYWALIIGDIVSSIIYTGGSYLLDKFRPKLSLQHWRKQWSFSGWLFLKGIVGYMRSQIDTLIVSKFFPQAQLGQYYMARDIAMIPSHNIISPAIEPLLAAFRKSRNSVEALEVKVRISLFSVSLVSIPIFVFLWCFPGEIIAVLLGDQWAEAGPLLHALSLLPLYFSFILVLEQCLLSLQQVRVLFWYDVFSLLFITTFILGFATDNIVTLAYARGALGLITMAALALYLSKLIKLNLLSTMLHLVPLFVISTFAAFMASSIPLVLEQPLFVLAQKGFTFMSIFSILTALTFIKVHSEQAEYLRGLWFQIRAVLGN